MTRRLKSTVSEKGQVTIPKPIRDRLGIEAGVVLEFDEPEAGQLTARKAGGRDPVDELYGILRLGTDTDEFVESLRGETGDA